MPAVSYNQSSIHFNIYGRGPQLLVCLHGYGQTGSTFSFLNDALGGRFTILAPDLPLHGQTNWQEGLNFTVADLYGIIAAITGAVSMAEKPLHILGYSMGGRLSLAYFEQYPQQVASINLVAPDGLHKNRWYWLATQTSGGNRLFKHTMQKPGWINRLVQVSGRLKLLNPSVTKFVHYYLHDAAIRRSLYERWTAMRHFRPGLVRIRQLVQTQHTPVNMLFGKFDRIILASRGYNFQQGLEDLVRVQQIDAGHILLQPKYAAAIAAMFM